jgi:hypothetical protein
LRTDLFVRPKNRGEQLDMFALHAHNAEMHQKPSA